MMTYEEVLRKFQKARIEYIIVGGIATNLLGALRATADLDIMIDISSGNIIKVDAIMRSLGYKMKQPIDVKKIDKDLIKDLVRKKHLKAINYYKTNEIKEVDIIVDSPVSFERAKKNMAKVVARDLSLPVISIDDLIKMKLKAGRSVDKYDVSELRKIKKMRSR